MKNLQKKEELRELLVLKALRKDVEVKLASGQSSSFYIDCKKISLHGPSLRLLSEVFFHELEKTDPSLAAVAGVSVGGDPLVAGVLMIAAEKSRPLEGLLVRKEAKKHGLSTGRAVEGSFFAQSGSLWLLEDVISTGSSSLIAARHLQEEGFLLSGLYCIVDRAMGGTQRLKEELKIPVLSLFKKEELV